MMPPIGAIGLQYWYDEHYHYDGVSEWHIDDLRYGRWCGKELFGNEVEPPFCQGELHPQATKHQSVGREDV